MATTRKIGDAFVAPISFGAMGISAYYGAVESDEERFKVLDAAYDEGSRHWDTANIYGDSEVLLGKWFKRTGKRDDIFLATKFGFTSQLRGARGDPEYVKEQLQLSLDRLGVDSVDLYYLHRVDPNTPIEVTVGAMAEFVKQGKVKYLGLSECSSNDLRRAHAIHPIAALQIEYSPFVLDIEKNDLLKTCRELGVTIVAYSPLARGLVTGQYKSPDDFEEGDFRKIVPKYFKENFPKILEVVERIRSIGVAHNATPGQVTLAWILAQGDDFVTIPGTKKIKYLKENMGAVKVNLTPEEIAAVRKIAEESDIPGSRYDEAGMKLLWAESPPLKK